MRLVLLSLVAACGGSGRALPPDAARTIDAADGPTCGVVGDATRPAEIQLIYRTETGAMPVVDQGTLPLVDPPQGGKVLLVGLRVRNVDLCDATIQIAIKDPADARVIGYERRSITWRIAPDGFAEPSEPTYFYDYANVPVCPNGNLSKNVDGNPWLLEARLYEAETIAAQATVTITPTCDAAPDPDLCRCECAMTGGTSCGTGGI